MKSVIVYGPQGCGKTLHAEKLRKHFRLSHVVDPFELLRANELRPEATLYIATDNPQQTSRGPAVKALGIRVVAFKDAMQQCAKQRPLLSTNNEGLPS